MQIVAILPERPLDVRDGERIRMRTRPELVSAVEEITGKPVTVDRDGDLQTFEVTCLVGDQPSGEGPLVLHVGIESGRIHLSQSSYFGGHGGARLAL